MSKAAKILLFTGLGILAAGIIISVIAFAVTGFNIRAIARPAGNSGSLKLTSKDYTIEEDFDNINVSMAAEDVRIQKSADGVCRVKMENVSVDGEYEVGVKNGTLEVINKDMSWDSSQGVDFVLDVLENGIGNDLGKVTVYLPKDMYQTMDIATASGEIFAEEKLSFSEVDLATASGDVHVQNLNNGAAESAAPEGAAGATQGTSAIASGEAGTKEEAASGKQAAADALVEGTASVAAEEAGAAMTGSLVLNIAAASGDIYVQNCSMDSLNISASSGDVRGADLQVAADANIETSSGDIELTNITVGGQASVKSTSGCVSVTRSSFRQGDINTTSGDVRLDGLEAETMKINTTSGDVVGTIDSNTNVHGNTSSGDFHAPTGSKGNWTINTTSGDVDLEY